MSQLIKLPNSVIFDADEVIVIARQGLNEYALVLRGSPITLKLDGNDVAALENYLDIDVLESPAEAPKIVVADQP